MFFKERFWGWSIFVATISWLYCIFFLSPDEINQGFVQKIMYVHVPAIFVTYAAFFCVFLFSLGYLWKKTEAYDRRAGVFGEMGTLFCFISLLTGSIWGKPTWNTYWVWDARLTFTLLLFLIFAAYVLLRKFSEDGGDQAKISAYIGIIGFCLVPLNHFAVKWWRTLHQPSTLFTSSDTIAPSIKSLLLISIFYFFLLFFFLFLYRYKIEKEEREMLVNFYKQK